MSSIADFLAQIAQHKLNVQKNLTRIAQISSTTLMDHIIDDTPIDVSEDRDTIVARGDWNATVGGEPPDVNRGDMSGDSAKSAIRAVVGTWDPLTGSPIKFANHKKYIVDLEFGGYTWVKNHVYSNEEGFSRQAPAGMVRVNAADWAMLVEDVARKTHGVS